jgi:hypothetical protein
MTGSLADKRGFRRETPLPTQTRDHATTMNDRAAGASPLVSLDGTAPRDDVVIAMAGRGQRPGAR